jgi:hypothetical protein
MTGPGATQEAQATGVQLHRHTLWHNRRRALNVSRLNQPRKQFWKRMIATVTDTA